jgi:hypothetical protein
MMLLQHSSAKVVLRFTGENALIQSKALILTILFDKIGLFSTLFQRPCTFVCIFYINIITFVYCYR